MKVLKFGGTSFASPENVNRIKSIVAKQHDDVLIVVSALNMVTDNLLDTAYAASNSTSFHTKLAEIKEQHTTLTTELLPGESSVSVLNTIENTFSELEQILQGVSLIGELTSKTLDRVMGYGEILSAEILSASLNAKVIDSRAVIKTNEQYGKAMVNFDLSNRKIRESLVHAKGIYVAAGFIASSENNVPTTLGRGGSDYSAAIYAAALDAYLLEIWTDVDGFMTADSKVINHTYSIPSLTYSEALELSHFGAKVIYPPTILPVYKKGIPIRIKNIENPEAEGTLISRGDDASREPMIKGISSISDITLVTLQGLGMVGVSGIAMRLFGALAKADINVILISQASSENSISIAIRSAMAEEARTALQQEFEDEIGTGGISRITLEDDLSVVAIVGENMKQSAGIAGKVFQTIGRNGINVVSIAQGASEQNISWVVKDSDLRKTLNVMHESFFLSQYQELNVFLIGIGTVGKDLLEQMEAQQTKLMEESRLKIRLTGVANSRKMVFNREGIDLSNFSEALDNSPMKSDLKGFVKQIKEMNLYNSVFVDCTAHKVVSDLYDEILDGYVSVVAANKVAASSEYTRYEKLKGIAKRRGVKFLFETNVGAGLPLISTINDLLRSGDKVLKVEAVLSGTLNYIFNTLSKDIPMSKAILMAKEAGFAEPDPRIDLSGMDVARKVLILARESGYALEMDDIEITPFIPQSLFDGTLEEFWNDVTSQNEVFEKQRLELEKDNKKWRFVGRFENEKGSCALEIVDEKHPFHDLEGSNNIVLLTTERYKEYPMQIKGYGAGAAVTAAGVFADLIKVSNI